jgi:hypothetical protein
MISNSPRIDGLEEIESCHDPGGNIACWLFDQIGWPSVFSQLDDTISARVANVIGENGRAVVACSGSPEFRTQAPFIKRVVAQDQGHAVAAYELAS